MFTAEAPSAPGATSVVTLPSRHENACAPGSTLVPYPGELVAVTTPRSFSSAGNAAWPSVIVGRAVIVTRRGRTPSCAPTGETGTSATPRPVTTATTAQAASRRLPPCMPRRPCRIVVIAPPLRADVTAGSTLSATDGQV